MAGVHGAFGGARAKAAAGRLLTKLQHALSCATLSSPWLSGLACSPSSPAVPCAHLSQQAAQGLQPEG